MKNNTLQHYGVLGMHWGRRKSVVNSGKGSRSGRQKSSGKNKSKSEMREIGRGIVDRLLTPAYSKTRWSDMSPTQKKVSMGITAAAVALCADSAIRLYRM